MTTQHPPIVERISQALSEQHVDRERRRHSWRQAVLPHATQVANPSRVRSSQDLFAQRIRAALD